LELGRWGAHFLGEPRSRDSLQPSWFLVSIRASFRPEHSAELDESYEFRIGVEAFHVVVRARAADDRPGCGRFPDVVVSTDLETFVALLAQQLTPWTHSQTARSRSTATPPRSAASSTSFAWPIPASVDSRTQ
jgi:hypothetical protein